MAIVVESTSSVSGSDSTSITVTAPAGITTGDTLIIAVCAGGDVALGEVISFSSTGFSEGSLYQTDPGGSTSASAVGLLYKIATLADESVTEYTITTSARPMGGAAMLRTSGWVLGNPIYATASGGLYQDGGATVNDTVSIQRVSQQLLIMVGNTVTTGSEGGSFSFNQYQITSSNSNPTWVELKDSNYSLNSGYYNGCFFCAYATTSNTSTITNYGFVKTGDSVANQETTAYLLGVMYSPISVTASNALYQTSPVTFSTLTGSTQEPTNNMLEVVPAIFEQSGRGTSPTQWTSETKPSTSWTQEI